jgi:uncharacterized protein YlxW (UPF0749 family)
MSAPPQTDDDLRDEPPKRLTQRAKFRAGALLGVLTAVLGFAIAAQVHANSKSDNLANLRADDLISILDNQNLRADQLRAQISDLENSLQRLQDSGDKSAAALAQAKQEADALGILLGTLPATGPGVVVTVTDPKHTLHAEDLLDVVEELRGAGTEAIDLNGVRVSTSSAFTTVNGAIALDGVTLTPPYVFTAIGAPKTLDTALNIPGGIAATVRAAGGDLTVRELPSVTIRSVRPLPPSNYVKPTKH